MTPVVAKFLDGALWLVFGAGLAVIGTRRFRSAQKKEQKDYPAASMRLVGTLVAVYGIGYMISALI